MEGGATDSELSGALQRATARASELVDGGAALLLEGGETLDAKWRMRAATGFPDPATARTAGERLQGPAQQAIALGGTSRIPAEAAGEAWASGDLHLHALVHAGRAHGVLCVVASAPLAGAACRAVEDVAAHIALLLDHARLGRRCDDLRVRFSDRKDAQERASEEVLELSEALFAQDIELLRKDEKIVRVERLKDDFIEKMSCELRTPLNGIIESIIGVLTSENERLSSSAKESLKAALDEGTRFLRTLQNILDLWKIRQGELPVQIQAVHVAKLVEESLFSVQATIDANSLEIEKTLPENLPAVGTDLGKLGQILYLVLDNATKFTPSGGIEIRIDLEGYPEDPRLRCEVQDTGVGICADDQSLVFDEFFQVDGGASRKFPGAGLGLALTRDLVSLLGGEIWIRSDAGRGTTLGFQIPVQIDDRN